MGLGGISIMQLVGIMFILVWALLWLLVPFILMGINKKLIKTNDILLQIRDGKSDI